MMLAHACDPGKLEQEDCKCEASLGCRVEPCLKEKKLELQMYLRW